MEKYFAPKRKPASDSSIPPEINVDNSRQCRTETHSENLPTDPELRFDAENDLANLPADPGLRIPIWNYNSNVREQVRREYLLRGPCQPRNHNFPWKNIGLKPRRFIAGWFTEFSNWLEYSIAKDAAFCLCCYLSKQDVGDRAGGDTFVGEGFSNWKKKERLVAHIGGPSSAHNRAWGMCEDLLKQKQHIATAWDKHSDSVRSDYRIRLGASIDCIRHLLRQGLAFRGHDESELSISKGNFLELLQFLANHDKEVEAVALHNAPKNHKLTCPEVQKDIVTAAAIETIKIIIGDIDEAFFAILVDESRDISAKEQMSIVLRYVDKKGHIIERFIGVEHVPNTTALSLKATIDKVFSRHGLSISRLRGQGYDGANNMKGEYNGLKALILKENASAFYVHCFAHQLQLALVGMAKKNKVITGLFCMVTKVINVVDGSSKRHDILQDKQFANVIQALETNKIASGRGLNQETTLARAGDTRWRSHYRTLISITTMFSAVIQLLTFVENDGLSKEQEYEAGHISMLVQTYEFVFCLHFMRTLLGITNALSQALQRKDQEIVNAMSLVKVCKQQLREMRSNGWVSLLDQIASFCDKHEIDVCDMEDRYLPPLISKRKTAQAPVLTNLHHYRYDIFYEVIDLQLMELDNRFNETNTKLLLCMACLSPVALFSAFDKEKILRLARFYPNDYSDFELVALGDQLENYIGDMRSNVEFSKLKGIAELAQTMVKMRRHLLFPLVYLLITLVLTLPVATATVERAFSAMKILKTRLRNRMGDQWLNDSMVVYIEKDVFDGVINEVIMQRFQTIRPRLAQL